MLVWLALLAVTVILPALGIGPVIRRGGRLAWNNAVMVQLPPDSVTIEQGQSPAGRKAQEVVDFVHRWLGALVIVSPVAFFVEGLEYVTFLAAFIATLWAKVFGAHFDLVGHGVEIIVAERENREGYRAAEIERMRLHSSAFKGWTTERIDAGLRGREWLSRAFVGVYA